MSEYEDENNIEVSLNLMRDTVGDEVDKEQLMDLLKNADFDVGKAIDQYFSDKNETKTNLPAKESYASNNKLQIMREMLDEVDDGVLLQFLESAKGNVEEAIDNYFTSLGKLDSKVETPILNSILENVDHEILPPVMSDVEFEVSVEHSSFGLHLTSIFGRAVVQSIDDGSFALLAGIQKSDVLVGFGGNAVNEKNIAKVLKLLNSEESIQSFVPITLRFRRAHEAGSIKPSSPSVKTTYGMEALNNLLIEMASFIPEKVSDEVLLHFLINNDANLETAVGKYDIMKMLPTFNGVFGAEYYDGVEHNTTTLGEMYEVEMAAGPLGLTVENVLERTIIVAVKPESAAATAGVKVGSWLLFVNNQCITQMTHKEGLRLIESTSRPISLRFCVISKEQSSQLRHNLSVILQPNGIGNGTTILPETDRTTFKRFQSLLHMVTPWMPLSFLVDLSILFKLEGYADTTLVQEKVDETSSSKSENKDEALNNNNKKKLRGDRHRMDAILLRISFLHEVPDHGQDMCIEIVKLLSSFALCLLEDAQESSTNDKLFCLVVYTLESILMVENHVTWDVTVQILRDLIINSSDDYVLRFMIPLEVRLGASPSPTSRVAAVSLFPDIYQRSFKDVRVQLRGMLDRSFSDDNPLVRRAAADTLSKIAKVVGSDCLQWLMFLLDKVTRDRNEIVRVFGVEACLSLIVQLSELTIQDKDLVKTENGLSSELRLIRCQILPFINALAVDDSFVVRRTLAERLPELCEACGEELADVIVDLFISLLSDRAFEVRSSAALSCCKLSRILVHMDLSRKESIDIENITVSMERLTTSDDTTNLLVDGVTESMVIDEVVDRTGYNKIHQALLPALCGLVHDSSEEVRKSVAIAVAQLVEIVGRERTADSLFPILIQLFEDGNPHVRATLTTELCRLVEFLPDSLLSEAVIPIIHQFSVDRLWRVRVLALECIAQLAIHLKQEIMSYDLAALCIQGFYDNVYEVRMEACKTVVTLCTTSGDLWLNHHVVPHIFSCLNGDYRIRVLGLKTVSYLAEKNNGGIMDSILEIDSLIEKVVEMEKDRVPNIRFNAIHTMMCLVNKGSGEERWKLVGDCIARLCQDKDVDVAYCATQALNQMKGKHFE